LVKATKRYYGQKKLEISHASQILTNGHKILVLSWLVNYYCATSHIKILFSSLTDITLITEGETSDDFYFYTVPSTLPSNLECTASYTEDYEHMIELTWDDPTIFDLDEDSTYKYSYSLIESMLHTARNL
jgi:hypothetical protein